MSASIFDQMPRVIGHRGAMGSAPENTLASFRRAAALGARWVEFDVGIAADQALVLFHDDDLQRITGHPGLLIETPASVLDGLDAGSHCGADFDGEPIPRLAAAARLLGELKLGANLEIKVPDSHAEQAVEQLALALEQHWPEGLPLLLSSFSERALEVAAGLLPSLPRGLLVEEVPPDWQARLQRLGAVSLHVAQETLTTSTCRAVIGAGYPVLAYTVNDRARAVALFEAGVSAVFSDYPESLLDL